MDPHYKKHLVDLKEQWEKELLELTESYYELRTGKRIVELKMKLKRHNLEEICKLLEDDASEPA